MRNSDAFGRRKAIKLALGAGAGLALTATSKSPGQPGPTPDAGAGLAAHGGEPVDGFPPLADIEDLAQMHEVAKRRWHARAATAPGSIDLSRYVDQGADDGRTREWNSRAFLDWQLVSRRLVDVHEVNTAVTVFGQRYDAPLFLCPVALLDALHEDGIVGVAREATKRNVLQMVSLWNKPKVEETLGAGHASWPQVFPLKDKRARAMFIERVEAAGAKILVLTVDMPVVGNREGRSDFLTTAGNPSARTELRALTVSYGLGSFADRGFDSTVIGNDPSTVWADVASLRKATKMKLVVKGILTAEDAKLCRENGADGVIVSNHGGRQEESLRASIECLPAVASVLKGKMPILFDGGVRRGTDVLKALALGADLVGIGRPYAWGLGAYGAAGVGRVIDILRAELTRTMQLVGAPSIAALGPKSLIARKFEG